MNLGHEDGEAPVDAGPPLASRLVVAAVLALLLACGVLTVEAWPLTAWKLFSASRDDAQPAWVLVAVDGDGDARPISLEELPLRYRHAEWPLGDLPSDPPAERDALCGALLEAVVDARPAAAELRIVRDHQTLVQDDGDWVVEHDRELVHSCDLQAASPYEEEAG